MARNKRCATLDLKSDEGRAAVLRLVEDAHVLVENFRPGVLERLGLAPDVLLARNPQLVICRVTAFRQDGPYAHRPGFATLAEAMSGFAAINGEPDGGPLLPPIALTDEVTALAAAFSIMVALHSGVGQVVDVTLLESLLQCMGPLPAAFGMTGFLQQRGGSSLPYSVPRGTWLCADGRWVAVSASAESVGRRVMELIGLGGRDDLQSFAGRIAARDEIDDRMAAFCAARTVAEVVAAFDEAHAAQRPSTTWRRCSPTPGAVAGGDRRGRRRADAGRGGPAVGHAGSGPVGGPAVGVRRPAGLERRSASHPGFAVRAVHLPRPVCALLRHTSVYGPGVMGVRRVVTSVVAGLLAVPIAALGARLPPGRGADRAVLLRVRRGLGLQQGGRDLQRHRAPVDLAAGGYTLELYSNGAATPSQSVALTGTVADGDVFVVSRADADPAPGGPGRPAGAGRRQLERRRRRVLSKGGRAAIGRRDRPDRLRPRHRVGHRAHQHGRQHHPPHRHRQRRRPERQRRLRPGGRVGGLRHQHPRRLGATPSTPAAATSR